MLICFFLLLITADHRKHVGEGSGKNDSPAKAGETGDDETTPGTLGEVYLKNTFRKILKVLKLTFFTTAIGMNPTMRDIDANTAIVKHFVHNRFIFSFFLSSI